MSVWQEATRLVKFSIFVEQLSGLLRLNISIKVKTARKFEKTYVCGILGKKLLRGKVVK